MIETIDSTATRLRLESPPRRVVSLVPSTTETVFTLGAQDRLVGVTRYCVHPPHARRTIPVVGGTKTPRVDRIRELEPDLVLANQEENREQDVSELRRFVPVFVSFPRDVGSAIEEIVTLGGLLDRAERGRKLAATLAESLRDVRRRSMDRPSFRHLYFIWRNPYRVAGPGTFIDAMLSEIGGINAATADGGRYPEIHSGLVERIRPDVIFLSSEPFPFSGGHVAELLESFEDRPGWERRILLVDGELLSWHGTRMMEGIPYLQRLADEIGRRLEQP